MNAKAWPSRNPVLFSEESEDAGKRFRIDPKQAGKFDNRPLSIDESKDSTLIARKPLRILSKKFSPLGARRPPGGQRGSRSHRNPARLPRRERSWLLGRRG